ncbi:hypothetical protein FRC14_000906 [Serendipita sp. 396]|nr:hypothetical protein FRC14_000906 [Serendipita sp. 396]KAG8773414.1 hypothetical protein FRC15_002027 [Serendipita sp. 397]KAG8813450.1 hypothetical protein FRC18_002449 [Serendipita sp. 400]KAG8841114.1 hypothetical protein FRB91_005348 [Serendipita sp. 411]KAG8855268.1 hypothetical protein FRC20_000804 [Serendipita sp. 405]KAG9026389.1 hypothetical protein FS842_005071 [Serendipita sp. 407]
MAGTPLRNLELFASLCGNIAMPNVTIVTTMWSLLPGDIGHQREVLLSATFWQKMIEAGCDIARFGNSAHSARRIALETGSRPNMTLLAQELVHKRKKLKSTEVGITLNKQLDRLVRDKKEASSRLEQMSRQKIDEGARHALELELRAMKKFIEEKSSDLQRLKRSVLSRICKSFVESVCSNLAVFHF